MPDPRVSVILPVYNVAPFVRAACDSVLSQSWTDLELIVIDDGSSDGTVREIEQIHDERIVPLKQPHRGLASARNAGLRRTRGWFVAFMDGDDLWLPDKLQQDVAYLESQPAADLIFSSARMVDEGGRHSGRTVRRWSGVLTLRDLLVENMIPSITVLMRREACESAGCFDEELPAAADYDYWLRVALLRSGNVHGSARVSALYRRRRGQLTGNWEAQQQAWERVMSKARLRIPDEVASFERFSWARFRRALAATAYENGYFEAAAGLFLQALGRAPAHLLRDRRTWLLGAAILSARVLPGSLHRKLENAVKTARAYQL